jgi:hypothetical protein
MKTLAIVGKPYPMFLAYLVEKKPELRVIAFYDKRDLLTYPPSVAATYPIDFSSQQALVADMQKINEPHVIGVDTSYENAILPKVWIGEHYSLPVLSEEAALAATDKGLMRQKFLEKNPAITPAYSAVTSWHEAESFAKAHVFPLILKPASLTKSLLVTKNNNLEELKDNFEFSCSEFDRINSEYNFHDRQPRFIIEEFLEGPSFSVDLAVDSQGKISAAPVVDLVMARDLGIADNYNYSRHLPSQFSQADQEALTAVAIEGVQALGLTNSAAHAELILTADGPKLIEIGARFGGYRPRMYELAYNLPIHEYMLDLAQGNPIEMRPEFRSYTAVYEIFPDRVGTLKEVEHIDQVKKLSSLYSLNVPKKEGEKVGLSSQGFKFTANIILSSSDSTQFEKDCHFVEDQVKVVLE